MNFCLLPADSNKNISSKSPSDYFNNIVPADKKENILSSNLLPGDFSIYENDDFQNFLEERANLILTELNKITE